MTGCVDWMALYVYTKSKALWGKWHTLLPPRLHLEHHLKSQNLAVPFSTTIDNKCHWIELHRQYIDSILTAYWQYIDSILTVNWQFIDSLLTVLDSLLTVYWRYIENIMSRFWLALPASILSHTTTPRAFDYGLLGCETSVPVWPSTMVSLYANYLHG